MRGVRSRGGRRGAAWHGLRAPVAPERGAGAARLPRRLPSVAGGAPGPERPVRMATRPGRRPPGGRGIRQAARGGRAGPGTGPGIGLCTGLQAGATRATGLRRRSRFAAPVGCTAWQRRGWGARGHGCRAGLRRAAMRWQGSDEGRVASALPQGQRRARPPRLGSRPRVGPWPVQADGNSNCAHTGAWSEGCFQPRGSMSTPAARQHSAVARSASTRSMRRPRLRRNAP